MGVSLTRVIGIATTLKTAGDKLFGDGDTAAVIIGGIPLDGFESPSRMPFGGEHRLHVHDLPGGARIIDAMGSFDGNLDFSGTLTGKDASARARKLDALRKAGATVQVTWADFTRTVVISSFTAEYTTKGQLVPYHITCIVLPVPEPEKEKSWLEKMGQKLSDSLGLSALTPALTAAQGYLKQAQALLPVIGLISPRLAQGAASLLGGAGAVAGGALSIAQGNLGGFIQAGSGLASGFSGVVSATGVKGKDAAKGVQLMAAAARVQAYAASAQSAATTAQQAAKIIGLGG